MPTEPPLPRRPPTPVQGPTPESTVPPVPPRPSTSTTGTNHSGKPPSLPNSASGHILSSSPPGSSGHGHMLGQAGNKLKQALTNRRMKKSSKGSANTAEDWEDAVPYPAETSASLVRPFTADHPFPSVKITPPGRDRSQSDAVSGTPTGKVSFSPRSRIESRLHAFTANLRRHHHIMNNPPVTPLDSRPVPPPKPHALRAPPSYSNLRPPIDDRDGALSGSEHSGGENTYRPRSPRTSDAHIHAAAMARSITPTSIAAKNVASAATIVPKNVTALAAKVVGSESLHLPAANPRSSFQMPTSPSITAALDYMRDIDEDSKEKRKSPTGILKPVPEDGHSSATGSTNDTLTSPPPRSESLVSGPRTGVSSSAAKSKKRRSASLGDVFRGGFSSAVALAAANTGSSSSSRSGYLAAQPLHGHSRSPSDGSGSSYDGPSLAASNSPRPHPPSNNVAAAYQYVNAELLDGDRPSSFVSPRPLPIPPKQSMTPHSPPSNASQHSLSVTPASTVAPLPSTSPNVSGTTPSVLPPRKKAIAASAYSPGHAAETSGAESGPARGGLLRNNIKGRLAAWTAAANASQSPSHQRTRAPHNHPPGSYVPPPLPPPTELPSSSTPPHENSANQSSQYSRARSQSHGSTAGTNASPNSVLPNPKRMTAALGPRAGQHAHAGSLPAASYAANAMASTAAVAGVAGGMALNLGRRVGNLWSHRTAQSGHWGALGGYMTSNEGYSRESADGGSFSDAGHPMYGHVAGSRGTRMLGTMVRPPLQKGKGAVFGRRLEDCVRDTRVSVRPGRMGAEAGDEPGRGMGIWVTALVTRCIEHLTHWGLEEEGLFRITGRATHVAKIRGEFDVGADYILKEAHPSDLDPHSVSSIFKAYLRELPEPILTREFAPRFDAAMYLGTEQEGSSAISAGATAFGVEAYSESSTTRPPLPPLTTTADPPSTNSSSSHLPRPFPPSNATPSPTGSVRSRQPSATRRRPSLASLLSSSKPSTPIISNPIPLLPSRSETPDEPPILDVPLLDGSFCVPTAIGTVNDTQPSPITPLTPPTADSSQTSDSESFPLAAAARETNNYNEVPRPVVRPLPVPHSPPPRLPMFESTKKSSPDDWAASVLMAAGGDN
ncbi:hypothetical protein FRB99_008389 [Tulasnella sp. 403]|nr:hypothetical protein FRB99_008389 [Tulasnella sp. 403]